MKKKLSKAVVAAAGVLGATLLSGCESDKPIQAVYGVPADIVVKNSNEYIEAYSGDNNTKAEIELLIERIEWDNSMYGGQTESTMTEDVTHPIIEYDGPKADELEDESTYKVEILEYNASGLISKVRVTKK